MSHYTMQKSSLICVIVIFHTLLCASVILENDATLWKRAKLAYSKGPVCLPYSTDHYTILNYGDKVDIPAPLCIAQTGSGFMWVVSQINNDVTQVKLETISVIYDGYVDICIHKDIKYAYSP